MQMFFGLFERGFVPCLCIDKMLCCVLFSMLSVCQILINTNFLFAISLFVGCINVVFVDIRMVNWKMGDVRQNVVS